MGMFVLFLFVLGSCSGASCLSLDFIFNTFGRNNEMNLTQTSMLMGQLGLRGSTGLKSNKCMTATEIFSTNGFPNRQILNRTNFKAVCPTFLEQIVSKSCKAITPTPVAAVAKKRPDSATAWGYGILSVTLISLASLVGAVVVPFMHKDFYKKALLGMVSLAVGVLGGGGLFHLIPHALELGGHGGEHKEGEHGGGHKKENHGYLWKCCVIVVGLYFFFITENLMKMYIRFAEWKKAKKSGNISYDSKLNDVSEITLDCHMVAVIDGVHNNQGLDLSEKISRSELRTKSQDKEDSIDLKDNASVKSDSFFTKVAPVAWMIILGDGLHNFIDGLAIGVSFSTDTLQGVSTSLAILCEELPHELGDFAILLNSGLSYKHALLANFLSACTCYIGMIIGTILGAKTASVHWIYALAGGMFLYISLVDMLPEATGMQVAISGRSKKQTAWNFLLLNFMMILGFVLMLILALYSHSIKI